MFKCDFCKSELSTKSALKVHQSNAVYCLEKQGIKSHSLKCEYCDRKFKLSSSVKRHENICESKNLQYKNIELVKNIQNLEEDNKKLIKQYEEKMADRDKIYQQELTRIKQLHEYELRERDTIIKCEKEKIELLREELKMANERITTVNNTNNNNYSTNSTNNIKAKYAHLNILDLSTERIKSATEHYTLDDYNRGPEGMADWCVKYVLRDDSGKIHYICTDKNRRNFVYRDSNGTIVNDSQANKLKEVIKPLMNMKLKECKKSKYMELSEIDDDTNEIMDDINRIHRENKDYGVQFEKSLVDKTYS